MKMSNKKNSKSSAQEGLSHTMGLRIDDLMYQKLEELSQEMNMKKSQLLKHAFMRFVNQYDSSQRENMITVEKTTFGMLLNEISSEKIIEIGNIAGEKMAGMIQMRLLQVKEELSIDKFMKRNDEFFAGAFGWFHSIKSNIPDTNSLQIYGNHSFNRNFSIFVKELLKSLIKELFGYELDSEKSEIRINLINLFFKR
jgi:hypothetical protein